MPEPFAMIPRGARGPLRDLNDSDYKVLLQLALLKPLGSEIRCGYGLLEEITGVSARLLRRVLPRLVKAKLVTFQPGRALGRGKGNGPARLVVRPFPVAADIAPIDHALTKNADASDAPAKPVTRRSVHGQSMVSHPRDRDTGRGGTRAGAQPTTPTPAGAPALDPEIAARLAPVAALGVDLDARPDTRGKWILYTDRLTPAQVQEVLDRRQGVVAWPSTFAQLRKRWEDAQQPDGSPIVRAEAQAREAAAIVARKRRQEQLDREAADRCRAAAQHARALETPLGRKWRGMLAACRSTAPKVLGYVGVYPLRIDGDRIVLHAANVLQEHAIRANLAEVLRHCRDAFAPEPIEQLELIVTTTATPAAAPAAQEG